MLVFFNEIYNSVNNNSSCCCLSWL